jgi:uncharacterized membrane protein YesL
MTYTYFMTIAHMALLDQLRQKLTICPVLIQYELSSTNQIDICLIKNYLTPLTNNSKFFSLLLKIKFLTYTYKIYHFFGLDKNSIAHMYNSYSIRKSSMLLKQNKTIKTNT